MRKEFTPFRIALYALCALSLFGLRAYGQDKKDEVKARPNGIVKDWSQRYAVYPRFGPVQSLIKLQSDPRAIASWQDQARKSWTRWRYPRPTRAPKATFQRDWNIPLSANTTSNVIPVAMYPAKFGFNPSATPSCSADYVAYPVNAGFPVAPITGGVTATSTNVTITTGTITAAYVGQPITGADLPAGDTIAGVTGNPVTSFTLSIAATGTNAAESLTASGQPNLVIFNNLYSGTAGTAGICNRTPSGTDDGVSATVYASYFLNGVGGQVSTSPALSADGTKIAVVQTAPGVRAIFEVLAIRQGDGVDAADAQDTLLPVSPNFTTAEPGPGNVEAIEMGTTAANSDTNSSPFVLYSADEAYVGDDAGVLYRVINVFCTLPACQADSLGAMQLDPTWGTLGALATGCSGALTGPVVDFKTGNVFVGCSDGKLYGFTSAGAALPGSPVTVGNGSTNGGIVDPPLVDVVNGYLYVGSGTNGTNLVLSQIQDLGTSVSLIGTATLGAATLTPNNTGNVHSPAFNEDYFTDPTSTNWLLYEATGVSDSETELWGIEFGANHVMNTGTPPHTFFLSGGGPLESAPLTSFFNGTVDFLFQGAASPDPGDSAINSYVITGGTFPSGLGPTAPEGSGTSGIVVDNNDTVDGQTASIYFGVLGPTGTHANSAVKLTQSGLE